MATGLDFEVRRADRSECHEAASTIIAVRRANEPAIPPLVHSDDQILSWFRDVVMPSQDVWVRSTEAPSWR